MPATYPGRTFGPFTGDDVIVRWEKLDSLALRAYEVLWHYQSRYDLSGTEPAVKPSFNYLNTKKLAVTPGDTYWEPNFDPENPSWIISGLQDRMYYVAVRALNQTFKSGPLGEEVRFTIRNDVPGVVIIGVEEVV
jgi:hypothetical protein